MKSSDHKLNGFKRSKAGWIPNDWDCVPFSRLFTRVSENVEVAPDSEYREIGIRSHGRGVFYKPPVLGSVLGEKRVYRCQPGTLCFNIVFAWEQAVAILGAESEGYIASHRFPMYRATNLASEEFYFWYFLSKRGKLGLELASPGGAGRNKTLGQRELDFLFVPVPPESEQVEIAAAISQFQNSIAQTERLLSLKVRRRRGLMHLLLTGRRRFPEFVESDKQRTTRFGSRPMDWDYVEMGEIAAEVVERAGEIDNTPVFSCTKRAGLVPSLEYFGKRVFSENTAAYKKVRNGQFAYATNHIEEGSIGLLQHADAALVSPMYTVFQTIPEVNTSYLYALLKTELYRHIFEIFTSSSVDRRGSLRWSEFKKIHIALPSPDEQQRVALVNDSCEKEIQQVKIQLAALIKQKRGLMERLLTGKIRTHSIEDCDNHDS